MYSFDKFGRSYHMHIETISGDTLSVELPFTVEFDITRNTLSSANIASIRIYNLNQMTRNTVRKNINDNAKLRLIALWAGYGDKRSLIFAGNVTQAWSVREGVNFITQLESFDGGWAYTNSVTSLAFKSGMTIKQVVTAFAANLSAAKISVGAIGAIEGELARGNSYSGNTMELLQQITGQNVYIDNGKVYILKPNECIPGGGLSEINPSLGILNTPVLEETILHVDIIFEPRLIVGQILYFNDSYGAIPKGKYKITSLKHRGMISESVCGEVITSIGLFSPLGGQTLSTVTPS